MKTTLTTFDGYPRDDIDIAQSTPAPYPRAPPPTIPTVKA